MTLSDCNCKPKVSVIIPVYNVKPFLKESLDSVINQTYKNLEIIIVDDGSNDGSEKICDEYAQKDKRIKLIHRENGGLSAARNTGLDNMSGEFVAFLDSDDVFLPEAIEKSLNSILSNDVDCVAFKYSIVKTTKNLKNKKITNNNIHQTIPIGKFSRTEVLKLAANSKINFAVWNKLYKQEIWDNLRFPEGSVYEDLYIIFNIINKTENFYLMDDFLIIYRIRKGSITNIHSIKNTKNFIESLSVFENYIKTNTPKIYDTEQLQNTRKEILKTLIVHYTKLLSMNFPEKYEVLNIIMNKINNLEKIVKIKNCHPEIKLLYYMILNHPKLLSIFFKPCYLIYKSVKNLIRIFTK